MRMPYRMDNRALEVGEISQSLKALAKDLNIPVIAVSQVTRDVEKRGDTRPKLSDLRESGSIEQDADVVMFVHRPEYYGITQDDEGRSLEGVCEIVVEKQRNGPTGKVLLRWDNRYGRFDTLAMDEGFGGPDIGGQDDDEGALLMVRAPTTLRRIARWIARLFGRTVLSFFMHVGRVVLLISRMIRTAPQIFNNPRLTLEQMVEVGVRSMPLVFVVALFAGATTAWQAKYQLEGLVATKMIGTAVAKSLILELGPVLTALVIAGRVGSSISAELATMRVTEQIDALITMSISPIRYLILPRVTAGIVMLPLLVVLSVVFGILGGYVTAGRGRHQRA